MTDSRSILSQCFLFNLHGIFVINLMEDIIGSIANEYINDIPYSDDLRQKIHMWQTLTFIKEIGSNCTIELAIKCSSA